MSATQSVESQITLVPGNLIVGTNLAAEYIRVKNDVASGESTVDLVLKPVAKFSEIPAVWGIPKATENTIASWCISDQSKIAVTVTVTVGTPGVGSVTLAAVLIGPQA